MFVVKKRSLAIWSILLGLLFTTLNFAYAEELSADQAFSLQAQILSNGDLELSWDIAPGHYLYQDKIKLINKENHSLLKDKALPEAETITDPVLGKYLVYAKQFALIFSKGNFSSEILVQYQGCAKGGFCYLPENKLIKIDGKDVAISDAELSEFPSQAGADESTSQSETDLLANTIKQRFLPLTLLIFFGLGLLLSLSPCVLPMIPLVVNLIIGPKPISSHKALMLSSSYVAGMAGSYALAGVGAGMLGSTLQGWLQQPVILIIMSVVVIILALAQFDLYHFSLPHFNTKLHKWGEQQLQGSVIGAFILGIISALVVSPCVTAPLIGVLTYIGQHGNPVIGGLTLLCLGLGMGAPLIVVAMLSSMILPAAGPWMNFIKTITGIALLGLAIWILQRIIPSDIILILWGALLVGTAAFFKAFDCVPAKRSSQIIKVIGILLAVAGAVLIAGGLNKRFNLFQATDQSCPQIVGPAWITINNRAQLDKYLEQAQKNNKFTLLEVYADWCVNCKKIEQVVFRDPNIIAQLKDFSLLRIDLTAMSVSEQELMQSLNIFGPPAILFFTPDGKEIKDKRISGEIDQEQMSILIEGIK